MFTIPPSSTPSIGDSLLAANISWKYYGDQWNNYVSDPYQLNFAAPVSVRSRDNYPNPSVAPHNPYVPLNSPAIGDLFDFRDTAP